MYIIADHQISHVLDYFSDLGDVHLINGRNITAEVIKQAEVLLVRSVTPVNADLLSGSNIKFIASATSGIDHVDTQYLQQAGIKFAYAPGCNARSVAEYVLSCLIIWAENNKICLKDITVGIIGYGHVGSQLHQLLEILGISCLINDPPLQDNSNVKIFTDIYDVLQSADVITLHVPYTESGNYPTRNMVNDQFLKALKNKILFVNSSRGGVIDESSLLNYINENRNIKIALDVWKNEPWINLDLLHHAFLGTPHIAGYSLDGRVRATRMIYEQACVHFGKEYKSKTIQDISGVNKLEFKLDQNMEINDIIQYTLLHYYDPRSDSVSLRRVLEIDKTQTGTYFDQLRKNYPVRREFPSTMIDPGTQSLQVIKKLQDLGFMVKSD